MVRMESRASGMRQGEDGMQEATAVGDSQTQESGTWGRSRDGGVGGQKLASCK